jgi:hypothetical protein
MMPTEEVLILAMTRMLSGICTAGFTSERDDVTHLRWLRPVRSFGTLLPGDMTTPDGKLIQCCDVVELQVVEPRPDPPHVEDWVVEFVHHRPRVVRRLEGKRRANFFPRHLDRAPEEVLTRHTRSLCLVEPEEVQVHFSLDPASGKYQARMRFRLHDEIQPPRARSPRGVSITDLKFRALGRQWLKTSGSPLVLTHAELVERLKADALYLTLGLSRQWKGEYWPLVHAIHVVPDYDPSRA